MPRRPSTRLKKCDPVTITISRLEREVDLLTQRLVTAERGETTVSVDDAARILGVSVRHIRALATNGTLTPLPELPRRRGRPGRRFFLGEVLGYRDRRRGRA